MGDNHPMVTEDQPCQNALRQGQVLEWNAGDRRMAADARFEELHLALCKILHIECGRGHEDAVDFVRRDELGVQHEINVKIFLEILSCLHRDLHIADTGNRMTNAVFLREDTGDNVHLVALRHRDENVRTVDVGIVHRYGARDICLDCEYVERRLCRLQLF